MLLASEWHNKTTSFKTSPTKIRDSPNDNLDQIDQIMVRIKCK